MKGDLAFDTETTGLRWDQGARPFMWQIATEDTPNGRHALSGPALALRGGVARGAGVRVMRGLMRKADRVVGHNLGFDIHMAQVDGFDLLNAGVRLANTGTLAKIVAPERRFAEKHQDDERQDHRGYGLEELAATYVDPDAKRAEEELMRLAEQHGFRLKAKPGQKGYREAAYFELWKLEPEAMEFYAREDVRLTRGLLEALEAKLTDGTRQIWEIEQQAAPVIWGAEAKGIRIDPERAHDLRAHYVFEAEVLRAELDVELPSGWEDNNDSLAEALIAIGVPLTERTESGQIAVNKYALERAADHPIITTLLEYRTAEKFVSTYLDHFIGTEVIHPTFNEIGARSGRMSGQQPNMQNVPIHAGTAVRELFIPRPGFAFAGIDYEQIELRLLGYYLNDKAVIERIEKEDFFAWVASETADTSPWPEQKGNVEFFHKGSEGAPWRQNAKNATYAITYGVGGLKLGRQFFGWPADSAYTSRDWVVQRGYKKAGDPRCLRGERFIAMVKGILTGYGKPNYMRQGMMQGGWGLQGRISFKVAETGAVDTILGRHQWVGHDGAWRALSDLIQGGAADIYKKGLVAAAAAVEPLGAYPLLFIHDEVLFETPIEAADETLRVAKAAMEGVMPGFRPVLAAEGHIAYENWGEAK